MIEPHVRVPLLRSAFVDWTALLRSADEDRTAPLRSADEDRTAPLRSASMARALRSAFMARAALFTLAMLAVSGCLEPPDEDTRGLSGRILVATLAGSEAGGAMSSLDPVSGNVQALWETQSTDMVTELTFSPDGQMAAYRATDPRKLDRDRLIVRDLTTEANETVVATADLTEERLAGFTWQSDGRLAYGLEVAAPVTGPTPIPGGRKFMPVRFEVRSTEGASQPPLWSATGDALEGRRLRLVAVSNDRAAVTSSLATGGAPTEMWVVPLSLDETQDESREAGDAPVATVPLPEGSLHLAASRAGEVVFGTPEESARTLSLTTLLATDVGAEAGIASGPVWSAEGDVAWITRDALGDAVVWRRDDAVREAHLARGGAPASQSAADDFSAVPQERALALSPDGRFLLTLNGEVPILTAWRLAEERLQPVGTWSVDGLVWAAGWLPR